MTSQFVPSNGQDRMPEILGHDGFLKDFTTSFTSGRMHHAWLLTGPVGIGKASMARIGAAWLLANSPKDVTFVGNQCPAIKFDANDVGPRLVFSGAHPDYLAITPQVEDNKSGLIKVDQIRKLIPFMSHKPAQGGWRVAVIDSMDEINRNGANAMLKVLEEPPQQTVIFLIASRIGKLPATIRSRCRLVRMTALEADDCLSVLRGLWPDVETEQLNTLSRLSQGAPGQAVKLGESGVADLYESLCSLLGAPKLDGVALAGLCAKLASGTATSRNLRAGAVYCVDRLLRNVALQACGMPHSRLCRFEIPTVVHLANRHTILQLANFHGNFIKEAATAEALNLDFAKFLERHLSKIYEKTLP